MEKETRTVQIKEVILVTESEWTQESCDRLAKEMSAIVIAVPDINNLKSLSKKEIKTILTAINEI